MNIQIIEHISEALQVIIKCPEADSEVMRLRAHIEMFDNKLHARNGDKIFLINPADVLYFEAVDNRTFLYTENDVLEIKQRLYELEEMLPEMDFIRISKSQIANINKIRSLKPELNRTLTAEMNNGELLSVSRRYVKSIRTLLSV